MRGGPFLEVNVELVLDIVGGLAPVAPVEGQLTGAERKLIAVGGELIAVRGGDGLFRQVDGASAEADANVQITPGALEGSNVSAVQMLIEMISSARQFDTQMKLMQSAESSDRGWSNVLNLSS